MKIKYFAIVIFFLAYFNSSAQNCIQKDTAAYYTSVDIIKPNGYPLNFSGTSFKLISKYSTESYESFMQDFYSKNFYAGFMIHDYPTALKICQGLTGAAPFTGANGMKPSLFENLIFHNSNDVSYYLSSGETVVLHITYVKGKFWMIYNNLKEFLRQNDFSSGGIQISDTIIVPAEIVRARRAKF